MALPARETGGSPWLIGSLALAMAFWVFDLGVLRAGVPHPLDDLWEYALVARHVLDGDGWRTTMIYPPLWGLRDPVTMTVPVLVHGPLLPLVLAVLLRFAPASAVDGFAWFGAACAVLAIVPLFRIASRRFGPVVGAAAAGIYTVAPLMVRSVHHSASVVFGSLLVLLAFDWAERERPRPVLAGLALGATWLLRPELIVTVPIFAWLVARGPGGARRALALTAAFVLAVGWWWWHNWQASGAPLFNLSAYTAIGYWGDRPGLTVMQDAGLPPPRWSEAFSAALPGLWVKWLAFLPRALKHALFAPGGGIGWLMLLGLPAALAMPAARRGAWAATALALVPIAVMVAFVHQKLYVMPLLGLYAICAAVGARALAERLPERAGRPAVWLAGVAVLALPATIAALVVGVSEARLGERLLAGERWALATASPPERATRPMYSDFAGFTGWTTGRPTVWVSPDNVEAVIARLEHDQAPRGGRVRHPDSLDTWFHAGVWEVGRRMRVNSAGAR